MKTKTKKDTKTQENIVLTPLEESEAAKALTYYRSKLEVANLTEQMYLTQKITLLTAFLNRPKELTDKERMGEYLRREIRMNIEGLKDRAESLRSKMNWIINDLDKDGINANINTLGELQAQGMWFDLICGEFGQLRDMARVVLGKGAFDDIDVNQLGVKRRQAVK